MDKFTLLPMIFLGKKNFHTLEEKDQQIRENFDIIGTFLEWPIQKDLWYKVISILKERENNSTIFNFLELLSDIQSIIKESTQSSDTRDFNILIILNENRHADAFLKMVNALQKKIFDEILSHFWSLEWYIDGLEGNPKKI